MTHGYIQVKAYGNTKGYTRSLPHKKGTNVPTKAAGGAKRKTVHLPNLAQRKADKAAYWKERTNRVKRRVSRPAPGTASWEEEQANKAAKKLGLGSHKDALGLVGSGSNRHMDNAIARIEARLSKKDREAVNRAIDREFPRGQSLSEQAAVSTLVPRRKTK